MAAHKVDAKLPALFWQAAEESVPSSEIGHAPHQQMLSPRTLLSNALLDLEEKALNGDLFVR
jgi:hypothetical protein